jgi:enoyl-CoA hydratase/carnithine racemase
VELRVPHVEYSEESGAGIVTLLNSESGNRLSFDFLKDLDKAVAELLKLPSVRVLVIRSNGPQFSLGMDLQIAADPSKGEDILISSVSLYKRLLSTLYHAPVPVMSVVQGEVKAGGMGIVCASDIVIASETASFELSEVLFGIIPANVLPYLLEFRVTPAKARYLILTCRQVGADEAKKIGIADEAVPDAGLEREVKKICKQIMRSAPAALALTKRFTHELTRLSFGERLDSAERTIIELLRDRDVRKEIAKFQDGELPSWFDRFKPEKPMLAFTPADGVAGEKDG